MDTLVVSTRIYANDPADPGAAFSGGVLVSGIDGRILRTLRSPAAVQQHRAANPSVEVLDYGALAVMPGLVDTHVHINEPGRTEWEGFHTATKAAAAGGFTTVCDMPLNSIPPTTTVDNLRTKVRAARGKIFVDVAFWGGLVPDNVADLRPLVAAGVIGFKCFLCPSGVDEFRHVSEGDLHRALAVIEGTGTVLAFHAEVECGSRTDPEPDPDPEPDSETIRDDPFAYATFLRTRPEQMERDAIGLVARLARQYDVHHHVVHLSAATGLPAILAARADGARLTVETCHHYLALAAEDVPDAGTEFKCCPPIRRQANRDRLWAAIGTGDIDLVVSDHSPSTPGLKLLVEGPGRGDFLAAWGGISSVQFGLPLFWTHCHRQGLGMAEVLRLLCSAPARLAGLDDRKGRLEAGYDADLCVWDPDGTFTVTPDIIEFQHKATPYLDRTLRGTVHATFVRGFPVYERGVPFGPPVGNVLLHGSDRQRERATAPPFHTDPATIKAVD